MSKSDVIQRVDTVLAVLSDLHCGSSVGLIRPKQWQFQNGNYSPNELQKIIWRQGQDVCEAVRQARQGKRLVMVINGDAIEGLHHDSTQFITPLLREHEEIAIDAIDQWQQWMDFQDGDRLYFVAGTPVHAGEGEERVAADLEGTIPHSKRRYTWPRLLLDVNGVLFSIAHRGPAGGRGANTGNALRNRLRDIYFNCLAYKKPIPRYVFYAHTHRKIYASYAIDDTQIDGFLLPAFQVKTDYTYTFDPEALAKIGGLLIEVDANRQSRWRWLTIELEQDKVEKI